jgi:hypothetical protein
MHRAGGVQVSDSSKLLAQVTATVRCKYVCVQVDISFGNEG